MTTTIFKKMAATPRLDISENVSKLSFVTLKSKRPIAEAHIGAALPRQTLYEDMISQIL